MAEEDDDAEIARRFPRRPDENQVEYIRRLAVEMGLVAAGDESDIKRVPPVDVEPAAPKTATVVPFDRSRAESCLPPGDRTDTGE